MERGNNHDRKNGYVRFSSVYNKKKQIRSGMTQTKK